MPISFKALIEQIESFKPASISSNNPENLINKVLPLDPGSELYEPDALYIGKSSEIPKQYPANILCIEDVPIAFKSGPLPFINFTVLPKETDLLELYVSLCNYLLDNDKAIHAGANLLSALAKARGLESIVAVAYKIVGNPIIVSDKSWKVLAIASDVKEPDDVAWSEFTKFGTLSFDTVSLNIKYKLTDRIEQSEAPFICQEDNMKYRRLFWKVAVGSRPVATVSFIEYNRPVNERDFLLMSMLCNAISAEMQKNKFMHYTRGLLYEEFIVDLIEGRVKNSNIIEEKVKSLNLGLKKYIHVITIDIRGFDTENFSVPYLRDYLEKMITGSKAIIYGDSITIVTSYSHEHELFEVDAAKLKEFLKRYGIRGGISRSFRKLEELKDHYYQALEALDLGAHIDLDACIYYYEDYAIYHIAKVCAGSSDLKQFYHPKLEYLMAYDEEHKTSFTDSLYTYLKHSRNITNTAKALHLHRNSMIYHLKRIEEILDFSLSDNEMLLHIELSFRLMEYDKKFNRKVLNHHGEEE